MKTIKKAAPGRTALDTTRLYFNRTIKALATVPADVLLVLFFVLLPIVSFIARGLS